MAKPWEEDAERMRAISPEAQRIKDAEAALTPWEKDERAIERARLQKEVDEGVARLETGKARYQTPAENLRSGMLHRMGDVAANVGNILAPEKFERGAISDEEILRRRAEHEGVLATPEGMAGGLLGDVAMTAAIPVGGAGTAAVRTATALPRMARAAAGMAQQSKGLYPALGASGKALSRAVGQPAGLAARTGGTALEGAGIGAVYGGPEGRGEGALVGAGLGGGLPLIGAGLKRAGVTGLTGLTKAGENLSRRYGIEVPLAQGGKRLSKSIYQLLGSLPVIGSGLRGQQAGAEKAFRGVAGRLALPKGERNRIVGGDTSDKIFRKLNDYWKNAYNFMNKETFKLKDQLTPAVRESIELAGGTVPKGNLVTGKELLTMRRQLQELSDDVNRTFSDDEWRTLQQARDSLEDVVKTGNTGSAAKSADVWKQYRDMAKPYKNYLDIKAAGRKAPRGGSQFTPEQLAQASKGRAGPAGLEGRGGLQRVGKRGAEGLEDFPSGEGIFQAAAALGLMGASGAGLIYEPGTTIPLLAGAYGLTRPGGQRALTGKTALQRKIAELLRSPTLRGSGARLTAPAIAIEEDMRNR